MHVTACLAGQEGVDVEVGESCRTLQALKEAIVVALPQLCVEGFDVSVGGRALDDDEAVVSLEESASLDVVPNTRGLSVLALREVGLEVSEKGLASAAYDGDTWLCTLYLDAGVPVQCVLYPEGQTPLHLAVQEGHEETVALLLDRGHDLEYCDDRGDTPLHLAVYFGYRDIVELLLERGHEVECYNPRNDTPLSLAKEQDYPEIYDVLSDAAC